MWDHTEQLASTEVDSSAKADLAAPLEPTCGHATACADATHYSNFHQTSCSTTVSYS